MAEFGGFCNERASWEQKTKDVRKAGGPCGFLVDGTDRAGVGEVDTLPPAAFEQALEEGIRVSEMTEALGGAHIEPDAEIRSWPGVAEQGEDGAVVPPDGRAEYSETTKDVGMLKAEIEGDEAAEGGTTKCGVVVFGQGAIGGVYEGLDLLHEDPAVSMAFSACAASVAGRGVFGHAAETGIGDAYQDDGLDLPSQGKAVGGGVGLPCAPGDVGKARVEEVLAVVKVEDGKAAIPVGVILGRQVNGNGALRRLGQKLRVEEPGEKASLGGCGGSFIFCWNLGEKVRSSTRRTGCEAGGGRLRGRWFQG